MKNRVKENETIKQPQDSSINSQPKWKYGTVNLIKGLCDFQCNVFTLLKMLPLETTDS